MSLKITNEKSEREQIVALRRQAVFMFIVTHLDADGCFSESDQFIANTIAGSNRKSVNRARKSLEETGDVMVIETNRQDATTKRQLPNRVRPVPVKTFWVREWIRQGSKTESCVHGENDSSCPREELLSPKDLPSKSHVSVSTAGSRGHDHKNNMLYTDQPYSLSVGLQSTAYSACCGVHGFDPPVQQALDRLRGELAETQAQQKASSSNPYWGTKIEEIEAQIAELEGTLCQD